MPKAEATGLAALLIGNSRTLERRCSGVFDFDLATSGWWSFGAEALGLIKARDRRAGFARRSIWLGFRRQCLAASIGHLDGLAQRGTRPGREVLHPIAFAFGLAGWARRCGWLSFGR